MMWSNAQLEQWHERQQAFLADTLAVTQYQEIDQQRLQVQQEMVHLLKMFLEHEMSAKEFNAVFQQKTHGEWNVFGLRGLSGGMFLNKLVKYVSDEQKLAQRLRKWLYVPITTDTRYGQRRMQAFVHFLEELITEQKATKSQLQPARVPFLLSAWWHLQDTEQWPIFYPTVQAVIMSDVGQKNVSEDPIADYFTFRQHFLSLAKALYVSPWELEHLSTWYGQKHLGERNVSREHMLSLSSQQRTSLFAQENKAVLVPAPQTILPYGSIPGEEDLLDKHEQDSSLHTHLQWLLAKIGQKVGCQVWIAINDHSRVWQHERLGDLSLKTLPILTGSAFQRIVSRIDVLWFQHDKVVAAYEIEHTTDISTGLLRLYDLGVLFPGSVMSLCVVTPKDRLKRVQFELSRPIFEGHEMRKLCTVISEDTLLQHEEHILRWAGSPSVIESLAYKVNHGE